MLLNISFQLLCQAFVSPLKKAEHKIPVGATSPIFKGLLAELRIGSGK